MRYRFGGHTLDTSTLQLLAGDTEVDVEPQVFAVLAHLLANRDRVVSKEELLDQVWGSRFVSESALTTRIKQARQALGDTGREQRVIRTFHGRGYRLVAEVEVADLDTGAEAPGQGEEPAPLGRTAPVAGATRPPLPTTRYAESDGASIAFQTFGEGPDLVLISGFGSNVEAQWDHPAIADFLTRLGRFARVTVLDKRGVGLSDRVPLDQAMPLETRADDLLAVLGAAGVDRATILGSSEGGSLGAVFAATHPERVERLILHNTWATGHDFSRPAPGYLTSDQVQDSWGTGRVYGWLAPSLAAVPPGREMLARYERQSATPRAARQILELVASIDLTDILPAIVVPTLVLHRGDDLVVPLSDGRDLAARIPGARLVVLDGSDHFLFSGDPDETLECIESFITGTVVDRDPGERVLATVVFVDVVDQADQLGRFREVAGEEVARQRGQVIGNTRGGLVATFDAPGRAVRSAMALRDAVAQLGVCVRIGAHTAEIQRAGGEIAGVGVNVAGRVAAAASPDEVWVSRTVTDLVAGTGLRFEARGEHTLKGIDEPRQLFAALG